MRRNRPVAARVQWGMGDDTNTGATAAAHADTTRATGQGPGPGLAPGRTEFRAGATIDEHGLIRAHSSGGRAAISRMAADGAAIRIARGIAIPAATWENADWPERRRLLCLAHAAANPGLVLTGVSAARIHGLDILLDPDRETDEIVHLGRPGSGRSGRAGGHVVRPLGDVGGDVVVVDGVRVTTVARTIHDLRRTHGPEHALAAADSALRMGHSRADLVDHVRRLLASRRPGARETAEIILLASELSESAGESWLRWVLYLAGIPGVLQQVWITAPDGTPIRRVDSWSVPLETVYEFHGSKKYDGRYGDGDVISTRENAAMREVANLGAAVVQVTWPMLLDGSAERLIREHAEKRRGLLLAAGSQFRGVTYLRHERLPEHVTRHFNRRR